MNHKILSASQIDSYLRWLHNGGDSLDEASLALVDTLYSELDKVSPCGDNNRHELWLCADRGSIEDFGDYEEMLADGEVENREEFEKLWREEYPEEKVWYHFISVEYNGFRTVVLRHRPVIQINPQEKNVFGHDIVPFIAWMIHAVRACIAGLQANTYNETVKRELPVQHRTGTILRSDYWEIFSEYKQEYFSDLSEHDAQDFLKAVDEQNKNDEPLRRIQNMTAGMFYEYCSLGYLANHYEGCNCLSAKEQYYKNADGRDEGLRDLDENSSDAFRDWLHNRQCGGHPWEVCRGGNSTHISLYAHEDTKGYYLTVSGKSYGRSIETVKFYLALMKNGLPVLLSDGKAIAARVSATDKIGIVPDGVMPYYCESYFPQENILDFINLPEEKRSQVVSHAAWQPISEQRLQSKDERGIFYLDDVYTGNC